MTPPTTIDTAGYELSSHQRRRWRRADGGAPRRLTARIDIRGPLDAERLHVALARLVARHESLRSRFVLLAGMAMPLQVIGDAVPFAVAAGATPAAERREDPFAVSLTRGGPDQHLLALDLDAMCADRASIERIAAELATLYADPDADLAPPFQYADFAAYEREFLASADGQSGQEFWRAFVEGADPLRLWTDAPATEPQPAACRRTPGPVAASRLSAAAAAAGTPVWAVILATWRVLLTRTVSRADCTIGYRCDGRSHPELQDAIGVYEKDVPLRMRVAPGASLSAIARDSYDAAIEAEQWQLSHRGHGPEADSTAPHAVFVRHRHDAPRAGGIEVRVEDVDDAPRDPRLVLRLIERDGEPPELRVEYDAARVAAAWAEQHLSRLLVSIERAALAPDRDASDLDVLDPEERQQVLSEFAAGRQRTNAAGRVHDWIAARATDSPDAIAIVAADRHLSYAALDARADALADRLTAAGAAPERLVAVHLDRSPDLVVALIAILKTGAAYVPLHRGWPPMRLAEIVRDCHPVAVIAEQQTAWLRGVATPVIAAASSVAAPASPRRRRAAPAPDNLAYVIYTSGSSGAPKGVMVTHGGLANYAAWAAERYDMERLRRSVVTSSVSFDLTVTSLLVPLTCGCAVQLADEGDEMRALSESGAGLAPASLLKLTPGHLALLADAAGARTRRADVLVVGGEQLSGRLVRDWLARRPDTRVFNEYGPTETVVGCAIHEATAEDGGQPVVPIGRPIDNTSLYVLDRSGQPVPVGVEGELYIGGAGVARGYWSRPALTADLFRPDACGPTPGARLYRSGDRARWRDDGRLECFGRVDEQVKIRGYRVEPGEIEAVLQQHAAVAQAVVVPIDRGGDRSLCAYLVARRGATLLTSAVHQHLQARVPDYMVPAAFVELPRIPLTTNGKIDRRRLPAPDAGVSGDAIRAPRTAVEEILAGIWGDVLQRAPVGIDRKFFDVGGHSLRATQVIARIRQAFGVTLPLRTLFEAPTIADLAVRVEQARRACKAERPPIERVDRSRPLPLSSAQQRLWLMNQLEPEGSAYNMRFAVRIAGAFDASAAAHAVNTIVDRHEILRTTIGLHDGQPCQRISGPTPMHLPVVDLSAAGNDGAIRHAIARHGRWPFDLRRDFPLRVVIARLGPEDHVLAAALHHVAGDGASVEILKREFRTLYEARQAGRTPDLADLPIQYADIAAWQRRWVSGELIRDELVYWQRQLVDLPVLDIPSDRPRPARPTRRGATVSRRMPPAQVDDLRAFSRREGVTLFMTLLAGMHVLLARVTGETDVAVASPVATRPAVEAEHVIGCFVNTVVLRGNVGAARTFPELVRRTRDVVLEAHQHQDLPFERLIEELRPVRDLQREPLADILFGAWTRGGEEVHADARALDGGDTSTPFSLDVQVIDVAGGLTVRAIYATDLFDAATIERLVEDYLRILAQGASTAEVTLRDLRVLDRREREAIVQTWNETAREYPLAESVHEGIARIAAASPDAVAVCCGTSHLSYAELDRQADRVALRLRAAGVRHDTRVGVLLERSVGIPVALLGVWRAGGAYVPIDPRHPPLRSAASVRDADARLLLANVDVPEPLAGWPLLDLRTLDHVVDSAPAAAGRPSPSTLAYVLHTSGSTGAPKGVCVEHRSLRNALCAMGDVPGLTAADTLVALTTLTFDIAALEVWLPLLCGARLVIADSGDAADPAALARLLRQSGATVVQATPTTWQALLDSTDGPLPVRALVGGEPLPPALASALRVRCAEAWNMYGPTETTIWSTCARLDSSGERVTIGRPIANTRVYVLDSDGEPVPVGVPGALYIGGDGLARGYANQPAATAERFVPDPWARQAGARMYRTGDRARWLAGGQLECLGRDDTQLKIRGFRIEAGEVEAALVSHPAVAAAVVVACDHAGDRRLAAYVVPVDAPVDAGELAMHVRGRLPDYMMPAVFISIERLPLTRNGKIDRKALPAPHFDGAPGRAPRTDVEEIVANIWAEVLHAEAVPADRNFFDLGGHSILAAQAMSRVRQAFGLELPLRALFESPTVAALSARIEAATPARRVDRPPLQPVPREGRVPLSYEQQQLWIIEQLHPGTADYHLPLSLRATGPIDLRAMAAAFTRIVERHEVLRTTYVVQQGTPEQRISQPAPVPIPVVDVQHLGERRVRALVGADLHRPFDLASEMPLRVRVFRLGAADHVLLLVVHHIAADAWSLDVLAREFAAGYAAAVEGRSWAPPALPLQYADYAAWQRRCLDEREVERQSAWWERELTGVRPVHLPSQGAPDRDASHQTAEERFPLPHDLCVALRRASAAQHATLFSLTLAALTAVLYRYSRQPDIAVAVTVSNREDAALAPLVGYFINTIVVRSEVSGAWSFGELLERVKGSMRNADDHRSLPFASLVARLRPVRGRGTPFTNVMLTYQRRSEGPLGLPGVALAPYPLAHRTENGHLLLFVSETEGAVTATLAYDEDLFSAPAIRRIGQSLGAVLSEAARHPECAIDALPLAIERETA